MIAPFRAALKQGKCLGRIRLFSGRYSPISLGALRQKSIRPYPQFPANSRSWPPKPVIAHARPLILRRRPGGHGLGSRKSFFQSIPDEFRRRTNVQLRHQATAVIADRQFTQTDFRSHLFVRETATE